MELIKNIHCSKSSYWNEYSCGPFWRQMIGGSPVQRCTKNFITRRHILNCEIVWSDGYGSPFASRGMYNSIWLLPLKSIWQPPFKIIWQPPFKIIWRPPLKIIWLPPLKIICRPPLKNIRRVMWRPPDNFKWRKTYIYVICILMWALRYVFVMRMYMPLKNLQWSMPVRLIFYMKLLYLCFKPII